MKNVNEYFEADYESLEKLSDDPVVHEAYMAFADDPTQDQAVILAGEIIQRYLINNGLMIVPLTPTEKMCEVLTGMLTQCHTVEESYQDLLESSPFADTEPMESW